jgi:hypothetical protein
LFFALQVQVRPASTALLLYGTPSSWQWHKLAAAQPPLASGSIKAEVMATLMRDRRFGKPRVLQKSSHCGATNPFPARKCRPQFGLPASINRRLLFI